MTAHSTTRQQTPHHTPTWDATCKAVSRREAAERLGVCINTLDNMVKRGELRALRYGGRTTIPLREVLRLLGELEPAPSPPALSYSEVQELDAQE